jgi:hypothetical protein
VKLKYLRDDSEAEALNTKKIGVRNRGSARFPCHRALALDDKSTPRALIWNKSAATAPPERAGRSDEDVIAAMMHRK